MCRCLRSWRDRLFIASSPRLPRGGIFVRALEIFAAEFQDERLCLASRTFRAAPGRGFWSTLEGMRFAPGPTFAVRKETLRRIGGFDKLKDYLAEDFVMGKLAAEAGYGVILSSCIIEHHIGSRAFRARGRHGDAETRGRGDAHQRLWLHCSPSRPSFRAMAWVAENMTCARTAASSRSNRG